MPTQKIRIKSSGEEDPTENCYLEYVDGYLTCTFNHKAGDECLMNYREMKTK
jgi:hypothetical protein